jgi:signal transduction histidine kinase
MLFRELQQRVRRLPSVKDMLLWFRTGIPPTLQVSLDDWKDFCEEQKARFAQDFFWVTVVLTFFNLLFWPTDVWLMGSIPGAVDAFSQCRTAFTVVAISAWILLYLWPSRVYPIGTFIGAVTLFIFSHTMGLIGGPSNRWFHFVFPMMLVPVAEWTTPLNRTWSTLLYSASVLAGYMVAYPEWAQDQMVGVSFGYFAFVAAMSLLVGLYVDLARVSYFLARQELARSRDHLEARVEEKTAALQAFVAHLDRVQDQERTRLAQDLHDELGQTLTAQRLVLRLARRRYGEHCADIGPNLEQLEELLDEVIAQFRALLQTQRQRVLEDLGIDAALRHLARTCEQRLKLRCGLSIQPEPLRLAPLHAVTVYRCMQEALTNAAKHASATQVMLDVRTTADEIVASVTDDGVGIRLEPGASGFGLLGARERVKALNGSLEVSAQPNGGTRFQIRIPLQAEQRL